MCLDLKVTTEAHEVSGDFGLLLPQRNMDRATEISIQGIEKIMAFDFW
jgi:hypothetical protein